MKKMETTPSSTTSTLERLFLYVFLFLFLGQALLVAAALLDRPPSVYVMDDWQVFRALDLRRVYDMPLYFNPPWAAWLVFPLTRLPYYQQGIVRLLTMSVFTALVVRGGGADWRRLALVFTSAPMLRLIVGGNIDWLPALAFLVEDKALGIVLLSVKPQAGIFAALGWVRRHGWRSLWLLGCVALLSLALDWRWPLEWWRNVTEFRQAGLLAAWWNISLFPWGALPGLVLLYLAWKGGDELQGVTATLLLSPYFAFYTLALWYALLARRARIWQAALVWAGLWALNVFLVARAGLL